MRGKLLVVVTVDIMAWLLLRPWLEGLREAGFELHIACAKGKYYDQLAEAGFIMHPVRFRRTFNLFRHIVPFFELIRIMREGRFDLVNTHSPVAAAVGRFAAVFAGIPSIVYTAHGFYFHDRMPAFQRWPLTGLEWFFGRWTDGFMFVSDEDRKTAQRTGICGVDAAVCTIYNGVDVETYSPNATAASEALRIKHQLPDRPVVGIVGRIVKEKGYREFLEMAVATTRAGIDATWLVVGDSLPSDRDQFGPELRNQVIKANLSDRFVFTGMTDQVPDYLRLMDIFVLPSYREGFPRSILEAMATGIPVVATNIRGCREAVEDGITGYIVAPRDAVSLRAAVEALLRDPAGRRKMGEKARLVASARYDFRKVREEFVRFIVTLYEERCDELLYPHKLGTSLKSGVAVYSVFILLAIVAVFYVLPAYTATQLTTPHPAATLLLVLVGPAIGCTILRLFYTWRRALITYVSICAFNGLGVVSGFWTPRSLLGFSNAIPTAILVVVLASALFRSRNWRNWGRSRHLRPRISTPQREEERQ